MSNKEIKDRLSDGEGAPDERTDMEEQIDAVMDRLTDPPDDEEDLDDNTIEAEIKRMIDESD